uniref:TnpB n=1 Tax=Escherichia coli TaxID=562 RepID=A0A078BBQ8_ECOLX|nr:TnpB [Escherichia coli]
MYCLTTSSGAPPQEPAKYDLDQSTAFPYAPRKSRNSFRRRRDVTAFSELTSTESCTVGGYSISMWT